MTFVDDRSIVCLLKDSPLSKLLLVYSVMDILMNPKNLSIICAAGAALLSASSTLAANTPSTTPEATTKVQTMVQSTAQAAAPKIEFPQASPACTIKQKVGLTDIEVTYSRPSAKGREVFGNVVPYGKVWRTGANAATKLVFSTPVKLNGKEIAAGTYALMTIPGKDEWTVIINKGSEQWGSYKYDEKSDLVRFKVTPTKRDSDLETFTIEFNDLRENSAVMTLSWAKTNVPVKVEVDFADKLFAQIEEVMASDAKEKPYFQSAQFFSNHNHELAKALKWIDAAIKERDAYYIVFVKAQILSKMGDKEGALAASKHSMELAVKADDGAYQKINTDFQASLK